MFFALTICIACAKTLYIKNCLFCLQTFFFKQNRQKVFLLICTRQILIQFAKNDKTEYADIAQLGRRVKTTGILLLAKAHKSYARSAGEPWALPALQKEN